MTIDITALAGRGRSLLASAIESSGCQVDIYADVDDLDDTVDFDTLDVTDPTPESAVASNLPALIVTDGDETRQVGPGRDQHPTVYRVLLLPDAPAVAEGNVVVIRANLNTRLVNARLLVGEVTDDGLDLAQTLRATRMS